MATPPTPPSEVSVEGPHSSSASRITSGLETGTAPAALITSPADPAATLVVPPKTLTTRKRLAHEVSPTVAAAGSPGTGYAPGIILSTSEETRCSPYMCTTHYTRSYTLLKFVLVSSAGRAAISTTSLAEGNVIDARHPRDAVNDPSRSHYSIFSC